MTLSILTVYSSSLFPSIYGGLFRDIKKWMNHSPAAMVSSTITPLFLYTGALTLYSRSTLRPEPPSLSTPATLTVNRDLNAEKGLY